jgi:hypothetical protein
MNPLRRKPVSKSKSAKHFRSHASHTKGVNMAPPPMRGGYRM